MISTGHDWIDLTYLTTAIVISSLYVFKPWKEKTKQEIKDGKKIVRYYTSKSGRRGYVTKSQQNFEVKYWIFGFLVTLSVIIIPWILEALNLLPF